MLRGDNIDPRELEEILARAAAARGRARLPGRRRSWPESADVRTEGLKRFEFGLRRKVEAGTKRCVLAGSDEVPDEFKKMVEEYYRSLGKTPR